MSGADLDAAAAFLVETVGPEAEALTLALTIEMFPRPDLAAQMTADRLIAAVRAHAAARERATLAAAFALHNDPRLIRA